MSFKKVTSIVFKTDNSSSGEITCVLEVCDKRDFSRDVAHEYYKRFFGRKRPTAYVRIRSGGHLFIKGKI